MQLVEELGRQGLQVRARPKAYAPPFLMLGVGLENTTTDEFSFQLAGRYLTFDVGGARSELRIDAALGAEPSIGAGFYRPLGREVRLGMSTGHLKASVGAGDPGLPELRGQETRARLLWLHDGQDSPVVPSSGIRAVGTITHVLD
jgi:NTE family protein